MIQKLKNALRGRGPKQPFAGLRGMVEPEIFSDIVMRERARVDRNMHKFALVVFDLGPAHVGYPVARSVAHELTQRARFTDVVGYLDDHRVGVLLPETSGRGAVRFAEKFEEAVRELCSPLAYTVHTYPCPYDEAGDGGDTRQLWLGAGRSGESTGDPALLPPPDTPLSRTGTTSRTRSFADIEPLVVPAPPTWKRALDIVGASLGLVLASPLLAVIALLIKVVSPGPVFFRQPRVGFLGRTFNCLKFRTMRAHADVSTHRQHLQSLMKEERPMQKLDDQKDQRIIPFGGILRATGLDELPQLFNVLRGDMSLIGPRPCIEYEAQQFEPWQRKRFDTIPGLTGLWQVSGKNRTTFNQMMRLDVRYSRRHTLRHDLYILFKTLPAMIGQLRDHVVAHRSGTVKKPA